MNVLVLNWLDRENPDAGGAEIHLHESFGRLVQRGWRVTVVSSGWPHAPTTAELDGMEIHRVGGRYSYPLQVSTGVRGLREQAFDLVVEDLNKVPLLTPTWVRTPCLLLVHHLFGSTAFQEASLPIAAATWLSERCIPHVYRDVPVVAVSDSTRSDLVRRGLPSDHIRVVENGIDPDAYRPGTSGDRFEEPTVLYLGRLKKYKRVDLILAAVARLREQEHPVRLLIAGKGDHRTTLERRAQMLGLGPETVQFLGFVSEEEKVELLRRAWVHVLTSPNEGWGISNLEAAACATPTVASDSPGLRDSVIHGRTGFLVPHGDVGALAGRISQLLFDGALRNDMGRSARSFATTLSWDRTSDRLAEALRAAVAGSQSEHYLSGPPTE